MTLQGTCTPDGWVARAALCELVALSLRLPTQETADILVSGEFSEALTELGDKTGLDPSHLAQSKDLLVQYREQDPEQLFHDLRIEYTRLFVGAPTPQVTPYAGVWHALEQGVEPLMFISPRAMEIERFMRSCGVGQQEGRNEPLDHIATEFEFLQYLALVLAGAAQIPKGIEISDDAFDTFFSQYIANWAGGFANKVQAASQTAFYQAVAKILRALL